MLGCGLGEPVDCERCLEMFVLERRLERVGTQGDGAQLAALACGHPLQSPCEVSQAARVDRIVLHPERVGTAQPASRERHRQQVALERTDARATQVEKLRGLGALVSVVDDLLCGERREVRTCRFDPRRVSISSSVQLHVKS